MTSLARFSSGRWPAVLILLVGAALRLFQLGEVPPGFQFDEAHNAIDAARVADGQWAVFFPDNGGREPFVTYLHAPLLSALGRDEPVLTLRLVSALVGILTIAVVYRAFTDLFGDRRVGLLVAAFIAVSYWHVHFSRYGIRAILAPLWSAGALWAWWRAVVKRPTHAGAAGRGDGRSWVVVSYRRYLHWAALAGVLMAAAVYSHPSGRLLPLIPLGHALYLTIARRDTWRRTWGSLVVAGLVALVLFLPLGLHFWCHPAHFTAHPSDVSLAAVAAARFGGNLAHALFSQVRAVAGMFVVAGDPSTFHNLPGLPVFDPLTGLLWVVGVGVLLGELAGRPSRRPADRGGFRQERAVLVALWLGVMLLPTLISDRAPNYSRAIAALPAIALLPALGLRFSERLLRLRSNRAQGALAAAVLAIAAVWTAHHYFVVFGQRTPHVYYSYDVEKIDAYRALVDMSEAEVFLAPLWSSHATIAYLNADGPVRSLDATDTLLVPDGGRPDGGRDLVVAFPTVEAEREGWLDRAESLFGFAAERRDIADAQGQPLLTTYRIPATAVGDMKPPTDAPLEPEIWTDALFGGAIRLHGYSIAEAVPGEELPITFWWEAVEPVNRDLTWFVHLVGPKGVSLGQHDREPGGTSIRTSDWEVGDLVIDRYRPVLAEESEGRLRIEVGWYDLATGERLEVGPDTVYTLKPIELGER